MTMYDGASSLYSVSGGVSCCSGVCRLALMFITVLSTTFTIGTLIIAGSALYNVYNEPEMYSVDHTGLIQLWILVVSSVIAVFTNVCGFAGALFRIRSLLLLYAMVTGLAVGIHLTVLYLQKTAGGDRKHVGKLNITDDPHSVWTVEMNAYATEEVLRRVREADRNGTASAYTINRTVHAIRDHIVPSSASVKSSALRTVNTIQSFLKCCGKAGVNDFIDQNVTIPVSCCRTEVSCNATLRHRPKLNLRYVRQMVHEQGCGAFLHAAHGFVVTVITWVSYIVAGSQLCGAVIAVMLAFCCIK